MKTGRNDPCPCGSGKKFKRCCGGQDVPHGPSQSVPVRQETPRLEEARRAFHLANTLAAQGRMDQAIAHYEHSLSLREDVAARNNLGNALAALGRMDQAATHYERVLSLRPEHVSAQNNLGLILLQRGRLTEAFAHFEKAIALQPDFAQAHNNLGLAWQTQGRVDEALAHYQRALMLRPDYVEAHSNMLLSLNYLSSIDPVAVFAAHLDFARRWEAPLAPLIQPPSNDRSPERRLKLGYVSSDFRQHSVAHFIEPVLKSHDHDRFEIFCYSNHSQEDEVTARLKTQTDHWRQIAGIADDVVARQIRTDQIDILVDLNGHTANNRLLVFARKPAPVQVTWLGYPNTTGLSAMDYRLTDGYADPVGMTEHLHSEKLVRLPESFSCYQPPQDAPPVSELPAREKGYITFGSFNHQAKLSPDVMTVWAKLLNTIPGSRLVLKNPSLGEAAIQDAVREAFTALGIAPERLELLGLDPSRAVHLARYQHIDIGLDPFPYNGATTTCEALWMGVPVVTLAGRTHAGRVGASQMSNLGLTELICHAPDEYVATAVRLASDLERLGRLRQELRPGMTASPMVAAQRFTRNLEDAYRAMWRNLVS
jgi:predicted O-linked N-acetylglucosamine transferase (SPINDLY family)